MRRVIIQRGTCFPSEIVELCMEVDKALNEMQDLSDIDYIYVSQHINYQGSPEYILGSDFEDGNSSCVFRSGKWYYREPFEGTDKPIKNGKDEAVAHLSIMFNGG